MVWSSLAGSMQSQPIGDLAFHAPNVDQHAVRVVDLGIPSRTITQVPVGGGRFDVPAGRDDSLPAGVDIGKPDVEGVETDNLPSRHIPQMGSPGESNSTTLSRQLLQSAGPTTEYLVVIGAQHTTPFADVPEGAVIETLGPDQIRHGDRSQTHLS